MKNRCFYLFLVCWFLLIFLSCQQNQRTGRSIFRYNEAVGIQSLDPAFASGQAAIWACNMLYNGLVDLDDSLHVIPMIAKSWEISSDGKIYTFTLRDDLHFHDVVPLLLPVPRRVVASDFVYSFSRILDPDIASPGAWIFQ